MTMSMRDRFRHNHKLAAGEREKLWSTCVFVLDANALLNIYRYADSTRADFFRLLSGLSGRIWVPFQAACEFYDNRIAVIQEQLGKYAELERELDKALSSLQAGSFRKSAFLDLTKIEAVLTPAIENAKALVSEQRKKHPDLLGEDDEYLEQLAGVIGEALGQEPTNAVLAERHSVAQTRIECKRPPGYEDAKKPIPDRYGDALIWFEILDLAAERKQPVVFVTDDDKEDWWQIVGGKKLGPRPELRLEMNERADVVFSICKPAFFLEEAGRQLAEPVAKSSVDDAINVAKDLHFSFHTASMPPLLDFSHPGWFDSRHMANVAERSVLAHLSVRFQNLQIEISRRAVFDFIIHSGNRKIAVQVKHFRNPLLPMSLSRVRDAFVKAFYELTKGAVDEFWLYVVTGNAASATDIANSLIRRTIEPGYPFAVGFLDESDTFVPVADFTPEQDLRRQQEPN